MRPRGRSRRGRSHFGSHVLDLHNIMHRLTTRTTPSKAQDAHQFVSEHAQRTASVPGPPCRPVRTSAHPWIRQFCTKVASKQPADAARGTRDVLYAFVEVFEVGLECGQCGLELNGSRSVLYFVTSAERIELTSFLAHTSSSLSSRTAIFRMRT